MKKEIHPEAPAEATTTDPASGEALLELVAVRDEAPPPARITGVVVGLVAGIAPSGAPLVDFAERRGEGPIEARSMVAVGPPEIGREAALLFEGGDPSRPLVMGLMHVPEPPPEAAEPPPEPADAPEATRDGERLVFTADREIVLQCGQASITLTRAGKVLIRGAYLLTRASGVNRIQGGSVQIN